MILVLRSLINALMYRLCKGLFPELKTPSSPALIDTSRVGFRGTKYKIECLKLGAGITERVPELAIPGFDWSRRTRAIPSHHKSVVSIAHLSITI